MELEMLRLNMILQDIYEYDDNDIDRIFTNLCYIIFILFINYRENTY